MKNVLLLTAGNESSIEIFKSSFALTNVCVYGAHYDPTNAMQYYMSDVIATKNPFEVSSQEFFIDLRNIVDDNKIDFILLTNCKMIKYFYDNYDAIPFEVRHRTILPAKQNLKYVLFKEQLYDLMPNDSPIVARSSHQIKELPGAFVFKKPNYGTSGEGAGLITKTKALDLLKANLPRDLILCESLPGKEYTVDVLCNADGNDLIDFNIRKRVRIRDGIANVIENVDDPSLRDQVKQILERVISKVELPYVWFCQLKQNVDGSLKLLEINYRISGSFCSTKYRKDYIELFLNYLCNDIKPKTTNRKSKSTRVYRHFNALSKKKRTLLVDLDGTLLTQERGGRYKNARPILENVVAINNQYDEGNEIIVYTARGMVFYENDVSKVYENLYEMTKRQLDNFGIKYDRLVMGKLSGVIVDEDSLTIESLEELEEI